MSDAETLRINLPRLHKAGIAPYLQWDEEDCFTIITPGIDLTTTGFALATPDDIHGVSDSHAVTYAIGAIVEALFNAMLPIRPTVVRSDAPSLLEQLIKDAEQYGLIAKEPA